MNITVWMYVMYLGISVGMAAWVGQTLHKNGRIFLVESFGGNEPLADSVNHLLLVGFYLINLGYITLALKASVKPEEATAMVEVLSNKVGLVLLVLGGMHFFNLFVFTKLRRRAKLQEVPPPIPAQGRVGVVNQ